MGGSSSELIWFSVPRYQIRRHSREQKNSAGRQRIRSRQSDDVGRQQGQGRLDRQELAPVCPRPPQGRPPHLVQRHLPVRTQQRQLLQRLLGNGHPLQKTQPQDAQPLRGQVLARDLGFQASLLALLRERGGGGIHLRPNCRLKEDAEFAHEIVPRTPVAPIGCTRGR